MKNNVTKAAVCPLCGRTYYGTPAVSRGDDKTLICPDFGTRQAFQALGISTETQERIIETIRRCTQE